MYCFQSGTISIVACSGFIEKPEENKEGGSFWSFLCDPGEKRMFPFSVLRRIHLSVTLKWLDLEVSSCLDLLY